MPLSEPSERIDIKSIPNLKLEAEIPLEFSSFKIDKGSEFLVGTRH
jgi:hypothetical protein